MHRLEIYVIFPALALGVLAAPNSVPSYAGPTNHPPSISIIWPPSGHVFELGIVMKIKAQAADSDGSITRVEFFAGTNLIGAATDPPFNILWEPFTPCYRPVELRGVAVDSQGAISESAPVGTFAVCGAPPAPVVEIISPRNGALFPTPATFTFTAELLASRGDAGPIEFFIGTNSMGTATQGGLLNATTPPVSITVSNLSEGEYRLSTRYHGTDGSGCVCSWRYNTIRVVRLGVQWPRLTSDGQFQFEIVTSFPGTATVIQSSPDLLNWLPTATNRPAGNTFIFTESSPATNGHRFYRAVLPSEQP